jgi:trehalose/maltose hydrolase-like predicted phosphorylase
MSTRIDQREKQSTKSTRIFPSSGRIDQAWLEAPTKADPWLLVSEDPANPEYRDALLGNGLIGLRVPPEGEGEAYQAHLPKMPPTGCVVHGLWTDDRLMTPPRWHGLGYDDGNGLLRKEEGTFHSYRQTLDLRTSTLTTTMDWERAGQRTRLQTSLWISRASTPLLVIEQQITPQFTGEITFVDSLAGPSSEHWQEALAPIYQFKTDQSDLCCQVRMGERFRRLAIRSRIVCDVAHQQTTAISEESATRRTTIAVTAGETYTVTKVAAFVTDAESITADVASNTQDVDSIAQQIISTHATALDQARQAHLAAWSKRWQHWIEVGNPRLQQLLNAALYQCYAQLPAGRAHSLGPAALSGTAWHGRAFWDADLWTFPPVALLHPDLGRCMTAYRAETLAGAQRNAAGRGYAGACWAWESAESGDEKVPVPAVHHQRHINACVALAQWWDRLISGDEHYFRQHGAQIIIESAKYFASRVHFNKDEDRYELLHIKCPDENAGIRDNNATTNYSCVATLRMAHQACAIVGQEPDPHWQEIIDNMWIPYDPRHDRIIEYERFNAHGEYDDGRAHIKQADTTLLVYPWEMCPCRTVQNGTPSPIIAHFTRIIRS